MLTFTILLSLWVTGWLLTVMITISAGMDQEMTGSGAVNGSSSYLYLAPLMIAIAVLVSVHIVIHVLRLIMRLFGSDQDTKPLKFYLDIMQK